MKNISLIFLFLAAGVISCNTVYKEWEKESFSTLSWKPDKAIKFNPEIEDTTKKYVLTLGIRHLYGTRLENITVTVTRISPSGKQDARNYTLNWTDESGKSLASCSGNMCDFELAVDEDLIFSEKGTYTFIVNPVAESGRISGIMEFGFIISIKS
jgi:gliding motility-associated lipoprotein GldH